jgi:branched-subunit amino acid transport protein
MDQQTIFLTILGMMAVTYIPRALPLLVLARRSLPEAVIRWLSFIPAAVLSAMLLPALTITDQGFDLSVRNVFLLAALPSFLISWKTRSAVATVAVGMGCVAAGRYFLA